MLSAGTILFASCAYLGILFAIAHFGDKQAEKGKSIVSNPYIYALSLAVYCTAWTFYGSVGRASTAGPEFLPIYIGPTLMMALGFLILGKIIRISKIHRITSIADFMASRYGKNMTVGTVATLILVIGVLPYIALQLKAIATSFLILQYFPMIAMPVHFKAIPIFKDTSFYVAISLALFAILFGTRHLETTERHEGLVAAIAFESMVKLLAFLSVGIFVTYFMFDGFIDLFQKAAASPDLKALFTIKGSSGFTDWMVYTFLSMAAIIILPRQFQIAVVENVDERHLEKATWLFPLYLLAINLFVIPIAIAGMLTFESFRIDADTFALTLPIAANNSALALFVYIGGMSAATGMVIVESVALSTMICNDVVMPAVLRFSSHYKEREKDMSGLVLAIRRISIVGVLLLAYTYFRFIGEFYQLVSIGLVSFVAIAQFVPAIVGGIFWKGATRAGALTGLLAGFLVWGYTLVLPSLGKVGLLSIDFVGSGPFGIELLRPYQLFGLEGLSHISHTVFWSMFFNVGLFISVSLFTRLNAIEHAQASLFVDVFQYAGESRESFIWRGATASLSDLVKLLGRFLGEERSREVLVEYAKHHHIKWGSNIPASSEIVSYAEKLLAGAIGSASARVMVASVVKEEPLGIEEVMAILDETRQVLSYSRKLQKATAELRAANERLQELDRLKDDFISTVTHELRTPLTSIRSLAEILHDHPDLDPEKHWRFSAIIIKESERLTRLITQILDFQKMDSGRMEWQISEVDLKEVIQEAVSMFGQTLTEAGIQIKVALPDRVPLVSGDRDRLMQVMVNLFSNAVKFCDPQQGNIDVRLKVADGLLQVMVIDNGIGISRENREVIFEKFRQIKSPTRPRAKGSGLGLTITRQIVEFHKGRIWVESEPGKGASFIFALPCNRQLQSN